MLNSLIYLHINRAVKWSSVKLRLHKFAFDAVHTHTHTHPSTHAHAHQLFAPRLATELRATNADYALDAIFMRA